MNILNLTPWIEMLGWTLVHFLWQGSALGVLLWLALTMTTRVDARIRYALSTLTLAAMVLAVSVTLWKHFPAEETKNSEAHAEAAPSPVALPELEGVGAVPSIASQRGVAAAVVKVKAGMPDLRPLLPWLVGMWTMGVMVMGLRYLRSWREVQRWRASGQPMDGPWVACAARWCERLEVRRAVTLLVSASARVPCVAGWLAPVILMPAALTSGLSFSQLEAILVHELMHVRRRDFLMNLVQCAVETVLFFHPAVWWVSARMREEREHCCDDASAALCGGKVPYARALAALESWRGEQSAFTLAATGGGLLQRIRRLAGVPSETSMGGPVVALVAIGLAMLVSMSMLRGEGALQSTEAKVLEKTEPAIPSKIESELPSVTAKAAEFNWHTLKHKGLEYVPAEDVRQFYEFDTMKREGTSAWFRSSSLVMKCQVGSDRIFVNNVLLRASYPVLEKDGEIFVSRMDLTKLLDPMLRPTHMDAMAFSTVVIDPGHGGNDSGVQGKLGAEKFYNMDVAERLRKKLESAGFEVVITRDGDQTVTREERVRIANTTPASVFVSIHFNSHKLSMQGIQTYLLAPQGTVSTDMPTKKTDDLAHPGNANDSANIALAVAVHSNMLFKMKGVDLGVKRHRFDVLAGLNQPGILIEAAFLSHAEGAVKIHEEQWREELAGAISQGVLNYYRAQTQK